MRYDQNLFRYPTPRARQSRRRDFATGFVLGFVCALVLAGLL